MAVSFAGCEPESDCSGSAQKQLYSKLQIHPLVRDGAPHQETSNSQTEKKPSHEFQIGSRHQDRLANSNSK
jgi:hypothetical protein